MPSGVSLTNGTAGIEPAYPAVWARHCHQYVTTASRSVSGMERNGSAKAEKLSAITIPLLRFTRLTAATKPDERVVELHHKFYLQSRDSNTGFQNHKVLRDDRTSPLCDIVHHPLPQDGALRFVFGLFALVLWTTKGESMSDCHGWKKRYKTSSEFHSVHKRRLIVHCLDLKPRRKPTGTFDIPLITAICRSGLEKIYDMKRDNPLAIPDCGCTHQLN